MMRAWLSVLVWLAVACGGSQRVPSGAVERNDAVIVIECDVADAVVWVNGREVRQIRDLSGGLALSPGDHRLEIRHDDFHTSYLELTLAARERREVHIDLAPVLP